MRELRVLPYGYRMGDILLSLVGISTRTPYSSTVCLNNSSPVVTHSNCLCPFESGPHARGSDFVPSFA